MPSTQKLSIARSTIMSTASRKVSVALLVVAAFLGGAFFITSAGNLAGLTDMFRGADAQRSATAEQAIASAEDLGMAFSNVADRVNPAVVQIRATRLATSAPAASGGSTNPFERFFGVPDGSGGGIQPEQNGLGSGVFVRADGYIVTNNHVIDKADELRVLLFDGRELPAEVVGADPFSDLAVLKVEGSDFAYVPYGDAREVRVGQWVLAFGSPLSENLSNTVTNGIISSLGRFQGGSTSISKYIQTDAAVNPGNSGGPLVNIRGEIVGINSAIATRNGGFQGISFAIPVDIVQNTVEQLIDTGSVTRGYLGISFGPVTPSLARALDVPNGAAQISAISEDADGKSPAGDAGIREGDVITAVDGVNLRQHTQLISLVSNKRPGETVSLTYNRDGRERTAEVRLGRRPGDAALASAMQNGQALPRSSGSAAQPATAKTLGLTVQDLTPAVLQRLGLDSPIEGVAVTEVERGSEADREAQIQPGLIITEIDRRPIKNIADFESAVNEVPSGDTFLLRLQQPGGGSFLTALTKS